MNVGTPRILEPYLRRCIHQPGLTLLTSVLDTPTNWLLTRLLTEILTESSPGGVGGPPKDVTTRIKIHNVIFVSIWRSFEFWAEIASKGRLNLHDAIAQGRLCYVNGLGAGLPSNILETAVFNIKSLTLQDLNVAVTTGLQKLSASDPNKTTIIVFDGLDFLLACQPGLHSMELVNFVTNLQNQTHGAILTCAADSALLHNSNTAATPLELEHTIYARTLAHQAQFVFQVRPLETGHSKDVNGTIRISQGGAFEDVNDNVEEVDEGEWLYHLKNDGSVDVWGRGEIR